MAPPREEDDHEDVELQQHLLHRHHVSSPKAEQKQQHQQDDVKPTSLNSTSSVKAIVACTFYSFCSVSMILVNKSLASR